MADMLTKREPSFLHTRRWPFEAFREEMQDLMSRAFGEKGELWTGRMVPSLDLSETDDRIEARMDLPGIDPKQIDIQISNNLLTVSGERKEEQEEKGKTWHRVERRFGSFSRTVMLPCAVQEDAIEAQYRDGVLTISMPKTETAKSRKITVKS